MVVQSPSYPHQKRGAISVLFTPKDGVNKHFLFTCQRILKLKHFTSKNYLIIVLLASYQNQMGIGAH